MSTPLPILHGPDRPDLLRAEVLADLFEAQGIARDDRANVHAALFAVRLAAAQAGVFALDGAYADLHDEAGYFEEALTAKRLGFLGKTCLHPRQVGLAGSSAIIVANSSGKACRGR